jgi:hypothetical protein
MLAKSTIQGWFQKFDFPQSPGGRTANQAMASAILCLHKDKPHSELFLWSCDIHKHTQGFMGSSLPDPSPLPSANLKH